jgi:hypothetical protein
LGYEVKVYVDLNWTSIVALRRLRYVTKNWMSSSTHTLSQFL